MDVVVAGSSGLIGEALVRELAGDGWRVRRLVRREPSADDEIGWDPAAGRLDPDALTGAEAVVNLAGAGIGDKRWTEERKKVVLQSRTRSTALLAETMASLSNGPTLLLNASAIGFYGARADEELTEASGKGEGFLADLVDAWETATGTAREAGIRVACLRSGVVLDRKGGALATQLPLFRLGLGGRLGSGKQWFSWISLDDAVRAIAWLLTNDVRGPVNLTAPSPVTNAEFTRTLGRVLRRPTVVPVPRFGPKVLLGSEAAEEIVYASQRVLPTVLQDRGFRFTHRELEPALRSVLDRPSG